MTAKEYLRQYRLLESRIKTAEDNLKLLRSKRESISVDMDGMPHASGTSDKTGTLAVAIQSAKDKLSALQHESIIKQHEVAQIILRLDDPDYINILNARYIDGMTWESIAVKLHFSYRWVCTLHGRALLEVDKIINSK